ncbi:TetR/AcrR family transcriptional regulator [Ponticaulis koreensis]|uniref:TetR/AcrR family transcriptional regulator n=1 Tax=Ponticaulis koreensis TaxID=1123045 RepID=UPI0003B512F3|nr:TetR/AcrR family transcriptional regulator [Ponticaulis koreensis]
MNEQDVVSDRKSVETRARIFASTIDLINDIGTEKLTIRKIAEAASVSPALIIQYFGSKAELLQQAFEQRNEELKQSILDMKNEEIKTPTQLLIRFAETQMDRDLVHPALTLTVLANSFSWDVDSQERVDNRLKGFRLAQRKILESKFPKLSEHYLKFVPLTFFFVYGQALRRMLQTHMTSAEGIEFLMPHFKILADAMEADMAR